MINEKSVVCLSYVIADDFYHQSLRLPSHNSAENDVLLNKYGIQYMHTKNYAEWVEFFCTTILETK